VRAAFAPNLTAAAELPECIITCAVQVFPTLNCAIDSPCICESKGPVADALAACATEKCSSLRDVLASVKFQASSCGFRTDRNSGPTAGAVYIALFVVTTLFVITRLASRYPRWGGAGFRWDDGRHPNHH
jgi:hypothetical protein